ncbi:hypothetical protein ACTVH1_15515 [Gluconobacter cerinus]|uniref:hypothetical protein n=1 Tax=Gluconobacter oxydans TaxID=442 RepID=UPI0039EA5158
MSDPAGQPAAEVALRENLALIFEAMRTHGVKTVKVEYEAKEGWWTTLHVTADDSPDLFEDLSLEEAVAALGPDQTIAPLFPNSFDLVVWHCVETVIRRVQTDYDTDEDGSYGTATLTLETRQLEVEHIERVVSHLAHSLTA